MGLSATKIYRDKQGVLWIGTQSGLHRFDGVSSVRFSPTSPEPFYIPQSYIVDIGENREGDLFIATAGGLVLEQQSLSGRFELEKGFPSSKTRILNWLYISSLGTFWAGTDQGIVVHSRPGGPSLDWLDQSTISLQESRSLAFDTSIAGRIYATQDRGFLRIDEVSQSITSSKLDDELFQSGHRITSLELMDEETLILGTSSGVLISYSLAKAEIRHVASIETQPSAYITDIVVHNNGVLVSTDNGLFRFNDDLTTKIELSNTGEGLSSYDIYGLYLDKDLVWVSTISGIGSFNSAQFQHFRVDHRGDSNVVHAIGSTSAGEVWIGTLSGLCEADSLGPLGVASIRTCSDSAISPGNDYRVTAIEGFDSSLLIGFQSGGVILYQADIETSNPIENESLSESGITDILLGSENSIWIATHTKGLFKKNSGQLVSFLAEGLLEESFVSWIRELPSGDILIGAADSVYLYKLSANKVEQLPFVFHGGEEISFIFTASVQLSGDIWLGTENNGVYKWSVESQSAGEHTIVKVGDEDDFGFDSVYSIQADNNSNLWLATQRGLVKTNADGKFIWRFSTGDGLQGEDFNFGASYTAADGAMYFGGTNGFNKFYPEQVKIDRSPPKTFLSMVHFPDATHMNFRAAPEAVDVQVNHEDYFVTFELGIINLKSSSQSKFRYKLEGFDPDWVQIGVHNTATYTNLPPGHYTFRAQGSNSAGIWDPVGVVVPVEVFPPPWQSWWAQCIYFVAFLLAVWATHRTYQSYIIQRRVDQMKDEIHQTQERAEEEMQDQLEYQEGVMKSAYQHKRSTLELISGFMDSDCSKRSTGEDSGAFTGHAGRIQVLEALEDYTYYTPDGPRVDLHNFAENVLASQLPCASVDPDTIISVNNIPQALVPASAASALAIILHELIQNCLEHAFNGDSPANYITLYLQTSISPGMSGYEHQLIVDDTGVGAPTDLFDEPYEESGAAVVKAIAAKYRGEINLDEGHGTRITITLRMDDKALAD